jgi:dephospho-CoA kinase
MSEAKLDLLLGRQMPDALKRRRADFVIYTNRGYRDTLLELRRILAKLQRGNWPRHRKTHRSRGAGEKYAMARPRRAH